VVKAYQLEGFPNMPSPWGFDQWDVLRGALIWAGMDDACKTNAAVKRNDPERVGFRAICQMLWDCRGAFHDGEMTAAKIVAVAVKRVQLKDENGGLMTNPWNEPVTEFRNPEFHQTLMEIAGDGNRIVVRTLGNWLQSKEDAVATVAHGEGSLQVRLVRVLRADGTPKTYGGVALWKLEWIGERRDVDVEDVKAHSTGDGDGNVDADDDVPF
jgi:hypothetical protein